MLSPIFLTSIKNRLVKSSFFSSEDFIFNISETPDDDFDVDADVFLTIRYSYNPDYYFKLGVFESGEKFNVQYSPGGILTKEMFFEIKRSNVTYKIENWLKNIVDSIKNEPITRKVMKNEQEINEIHAKIHSVFVDNAEEFFSESEGQDLKQRLEALEKAFSEELEEDIDDRQKLDDEIEKLHTEIDVLKTQIGALTKKNWLLSLSSRVYLWGKRNPVTVRRLGGFTRELLPQEVKDTVPQEALDQLLPVPTENKELNT